jgi:hypothetical protein
MNLDLFTPNEITINNESNGVAVIGKSAFKKKMKHSERNDAFADIISQIEGLPKQDEFIRIKTTGTSDTGSIFDYIAKQSQSLDEVYIATWIISRENIDQICKLIDSGKIKSLTFVISKRLKELKKANYAHFVEQFEKRSNVVKFRVCNSHAKTFSAKADENHFTIDGSGNWTENPRIENYTIFNDIFSFNHNKQWMSEMM